MPRPTTSRRSRIGSNALALLVGLTSSLAAQVDQSASASWDRPDVLGTDSPNLEPAPGEIVVGLRESCDRAQLGVDLTDRAMTIIGEIPRLRALRLDVGASRSLVEACEAARAIPGVEYAEPNGVGSIAAVGEDGRVPNDTSFPKQWHLANTGQAGGLIGADIEALAAWPIQSESPDIVIAVIDTGIDYAHPEFADTLLQGFDCVDEDNDATAINPHGVFVAGIIGARANNQFGVSGVVQRCKLLPVRVIGNLSGTVFNLAQGIDYAVSQEAQILNMSLGHYPESALLHAALESAGKSGVIIIAGAGNFGPGTADANLPSASPFVMSIGATNKFDKRWSLSATGTVLDFVAPGQGVITVAEGHDDEVELFTGTSAAAPIASGIAALLKSYNPYLTHDQVYALLKAGAEDQVGSTNEDKPGWDPYYGHGRLNAYRSLQALCSCAAGDAFTVSPRNLTLGEAESWVFRLSAGSANHLQPYLMLGTLSGTRPGFTLGQTAWPLTFDPYTRLCLIGATPIVGQVGLLDEEGKAMASLSLPASIREVLAGLTLHHATAVYDGTLTSPSTGVPLLVSQPVESGIHGLPTRLFLEDFESGAPGWVFDNGANGQWHIAQVGECGAASLRAAYNAGEPSCTFDNATSGRLISPSFVLTGLPPYRIRFSSVADVPFEVGVPVLLKLVDETSIAKLVTQKWEASQFGEPLSGTASTYEVTLPESSKYQGRTVHLEAEFTGPSLGSGQGWFLDDVSVWNHGTE